MPVPSLDKGWWRATVKANVEQIYSVIKKQIEEERTLSVAHLKLIWGSATGEYLLAGCVTCNFDVEFVQRSGVSSVEVTQILVYNSLKQSVCSNLLLKHLKSFK